jgi:hypothetical protein
MLSVEKFSRNVFGVLALKENYWWSVSHQVSYSTQSLSLQFLFPLVSIFHPILCLSCRFVSCLVLFCLLGSVQARFQVFLPI